MEPFEILNPPYVFLPCPILSVYWLFAIFAILAPDSYRQYIFLNGFNQCCPGGYFSSKSFLRRKEQRKASEQIIREPMSKHKTIILWEQGLYYPLWHQWYTPKTWIMAPWPPFSCRIRDGTWTNYHHALLPNLVVFFFIKHSPGCCKILSDFQVLKKWFWWFLPAYWLLL